MQHLLHRVRVGALVAAIALTGAACGDDDDANETGSPPGEETTTTAGDDAAGAVVEVTAVDYAFEGLPDEIEAGSTISLTNASEAEVHEFVALRIPDDETRAVEELVALPEEEVDAIFGDAEPAAVILAAPGQTDVPGAVVGDGTLSEPGRYAVVCFISVGADPAVVLDPNAEGPPEATGPPHASQGMFAEVTVV